MWMQGLAFGAAAVAVTVLSTLQDFASAATPSTRDHEWVTLWGAMPQLTEPANLPPWPYNTTGLVFEDATIRQTVKVSLGADVIRLQISNTFGGSDLPITAATIALPLNQTAGVSGIQPNTVQNLTFSGSESFVVPGGAVVVSDPIDFPVSAQSILSISIYLEHGQTTNLVTSHPGSRTTTYLTSGNQVNEGHLDGPLAIDHWYFINSIEGQLRHGASTIAFIGDSLTDGRGSTTNGNDRWPDQLLARLQDWPNTSSISILNVAAGGNRVLADGLGPNALGRIDRDVISHSGVLYAIIFEGINDIGTAPADETNQSLIGDRLIQAYDQMIERLHRRGIVVFGATLTPMTGPGQEYGHPEREATRQRINSWIRESGRFDAIIDFDVATRDPQQPKQLLAEYDTGDHLHLNPSGYGAMAAAVDLEIFKDTVAGT